MYVMVPTLTSERQKHADNIWPKYEETCHIGVYNYTLVLEK